MNRETFKHPVTAIRRHFFGVRPGEENIVPPSKEDVLLALEKSMIGEFSPYNSASRLKELTRESVELLVRGFDDKDFAEIGAAMQSVGSREKNVVALKTAKEIQTRLYNPMLRNPGFTVV